MRWKARALPHQHARCGKNRYRRVTRYAEFGSVSSLQSMILGHRVGLRRVEPEVLATMPSIYQAYAASLEDWSESPGGKDLDLDLYDVDDLETPAMVCVRRPP